MPLKWHGGKFYLAKQILLLVPPHIHYCEPYAGGLSVLLNKDPEGISEVVNDIDGNLTNFYKVLQSEALFQEFYRKVEVIPFSQNEWGFAREIIREDFPCSQVDKAIAFFVYCRQSLAGRMKDFSSITRNRTRRGMNGEVSAWLSCIEGLPQVHDRLRRVVVLNDDAVKVIKSQDGPNVFAYIDPPYLHETREAKSVYTYEMTVENHVELLETITDKNSQSKFLLSGYASELYDSYLKSWNKVIIEIPNNASHSKVKERKQEVLWYNYDLCKT